MATKIGCTQAQQRSMVREFQTKEIGKIRAELENRMATLKTDIASYERNILYAVEQRWDGDACLYQERKARKEAELSILVKLWKAAGK